MDAFPRDVADAIRDAEAFVDARHATWREEHANARDATRAKASKIVAAAMFEQACAAAAEAFAERESRRRAASLTAEEEEEKRAAAAREARRVARAEERKRIADAAKAKAKSKSAAEAAAEAAHRRAEEDARRREARENAEGKRVREDSGDEDESTNRVVASDANADAKVKIEAEKGTEPATKSDGFVASASDRELAGVSRSESEAGFDGDYESDDLRGAGWIVAGSSRRAGSTGVSSARRRREDRRGELETRRVDGSLVGGVSGEDGRPVARRTSRVATTRAPPPMSRTAAAAAAAEKRRSEAAEKRRSEANSTGTTENDSATKPEPILARSESDVRDSGVAPAPGPSWAARASGETRSTKASATFSVETGLRAIAVVADDGRGVRAAPPPSAPISCASLEENLKRREAMRVNRLEAVAAAAAEAAARAAAAAVEAAAAAAAKAREAEAAVGAAKAARASTSAAAAAIARAHRPRIARTCTRSPSPSPPSSEIARGFRRAATTSAKIRRDERPPFGTPRTRWATKKTRREAFRPEETTRRSSTARPPRSRGYARVVRGWRVARARGSIPTRARRRFGTRIWPSRRSSPPPRAGSSRGGNGCRDGARNVAGGVV